MACVLKKIFIPCSGRRATSTPSPFLWSSLARCGVKRGACLLSTQRALCCFPWQTHMWAKPLPDGSGSGWWFMATSGHGEHVELLAVCCKKQLLSFCTSLRLTLGLPAFCFVFLSTSSSPLPFPSSREGNGNSLGAPGCSQPQEQLPWSPGNPVGSCLGFH